MLASLSAPPARLTGGIASATSLPRLMPCGLMALGLLLSMATQLRLGSLPLGPGEGCLALAVMLLICEVTRHHGLPVTRPAWALLLFWLAFVVAQCIGFVAGGLLGDLRDQGLVLHDAMTYPLLIAVTGLVVIGPDAPARVTAISWGIALFGALLVLVQLADAFGSGSLPGVDPWYWDRLRGWTANPNQWALFALLTGGFALHLVETAPTAGGKALALLCAAISLPAGVLAQTNAFTLAVLAAAMLHLTLSGVAWLRLRHAAPSLRAAAAWTAVLLIPVLVAGALSVDAVSVLGQLSRDKEQGTNQEAQIRLELWDKASRRIMDSRLLGWGPGPHLPIPTALLDARWGSPFEPANVQHPTPGAAPNFEAHNSLLEMTLQGGALAIASFFALVAASLVRCFRTGNRVLLCLTCGTILFGSFHVITRHPAVWFLIVAGLMAEPVKRETAATADRGWRG